MNIWTEMSVQFANQRNYLDELFRVYPISPNLRREISPQLQKNIESAFNERNNEELIKSLLDLDLFPIKDSYVSYLKRDRLSINRNPKTIDRISGMLYEMGIDNIMDKCSAPIETNRQMGPLFKHWIDKGTLGATVYKDVDSFLSSKGNAILNVSDEEMKRFANKLFGYTREKGLDFIARFNNTYVVGEAKFLTDFGGHQNAQFDDAVSTISSSFVSKFVDAKVIPIAILDGVLYIPGRHKLYRYLENNPDKIIISSLLLREFLFSL